MNRFLFDNRFNYQVIRHSLFFLLTVLGFAFILYLQKDQSSFLSVLWLTFGNAIFFFGYSYLTIFLLVPEFLLKRKILLFILLFILTGIGFSAIKLVISDQIFSFAISPENVPERGIIDLRFVVINTKDMTFIVALFCIAKYVKDYIYSERYSKVLEAQTKEAQRKLFQSQFDPHFLFNTINNLYALSLLAPEKTYEVIHRIKIVLNYINEEIQKEFVELPEEVNLVENYIQLEKLRYGKRLKVEFIQAGNLELYKIPPMILFILVENCFKHGCSFDAGSPWIKIDIKAENGKIFLKAENSKPKTKLKQEDALKGRQLSNLRKRLELIYSPTGFVLKISDKEESFKVEIEING